jgi:hypothetical protein
LKTRISNAVLAALVVGGIASTAAMAGVTNPNVEYRPTGKGWGEAVSGRVDSSAKPGGDARPTRTANITLHGGPVMLNTVNAYYIWYGNWSSTPQGILVDFMSSLGGSPYFNINQSYYNSSNVHVSGSVSYMGSTVDSYSQGPASTSLSDAQILNIVTLALNNHAFGASPDPNGIYFVLTSSDVHKSGFGTSYCGWHTHATYSGTDVKYSFVGDPSVQYPSSCGAQVTGPNGNSGADAMASVIAHELEEATTDPDLNAWYDSKGAENADKCAWNFGTTYTTSNGAKANMKLGTRDYLIQQNWSALTQACRLAK